MSEVAIVAAEFSQLKQQLDQARLTHRDTTLKSRRETIILKRLISRLSIACRGQNAELDQKLTLLRNDLEHNKDVSKLIPRLAVVERMVIRHTAQMDKYHARLNEQIRNSGETLQRMSGLPAQLKRDLRNLLQRPIVDSSDNISRVIRLVDLYERALKLISTNGHDGTLLKDSLDTDMQMQLTNELQHLITELDFDSESGESLLDIRNRLLLGVDAQTLIELALETLRLVLDGTHHERRSSQKFLDQVNSDLATLQKTTNQSFSQGNSYFDQRRNMTSEFEGIANKANAGLESHSNLEEWREGLGHLCAEMSSLVDRQRAMEAREQTLLEQLQYNENKISVLYEQTLDYRRRLNDQEKRMFLDHLTKVYNRAALTDRLEHEYKRWLRYQHPLCLAMIDIDHFKDVNDSFGHLAGDKALKVMAKTIQKQLRDTDFIARFGGEEFVVLLPDATEEERSSILQAINDAVGELPFKFKDSQVSITVSIGATLFTESDTPNDVIERADKALYHAKDSGRNQLIWI